MLKNVLKPTPFIEDVMVGLSSLVFYCNLKKKSEPLYTSRTTALGIRI
jgi:hypothetical protein